MSDALTYNFGNVGPAVGSGNSNSCK